MPCLLLTKNAVNSGAIYRKESPMFVRTCQIQVPNLKPPQSSKKQFGFQPQMAECGGAGSPRADRFRNQTIFGGPQQVQQPHQQQCEPLRCRRSWYFAGAEQKMRGSRRPNGPVAKLPRKPRFLLRQKALFLRRHAIRLSNHPATGAAGLKRPLGVSRIYPRSAQEPL